MLSKCLRCGKEIEKGQKVCSELCKAEIVHIRTLQKRRANTRICPICERPFVRESSQQAFCKDSACRKKVNQTSKYHRLHFMGRI